MSYEKSRIKSKQYQCDTSLTNIIKDNDQGKKQGENRFQDNYACRQCAKRKQKKSTLKIHAKYQQKPRLSVL